MKLTLKLLGTFVLIAAIFFCIFPQTMVFFSIPHFFYYVWETAMIRYLVMLLCFARLAELWDNLRSWKGIFIVFVPLSLFAIFTTPVFPGGGWIYSPPDREEVIEHILLVTGLTFSVFGVGKVLAFAARSLLKVKEIALDRNNFIVRVLGIIFCSATVYFLVSQNKFFDPRIFVSYSYKGLPVVLLSTLLVGSLLITGILYFSHICKLRLRNTGNIGGWTIALLLPLAAMVDPDLGILVMYFVGIPVYLVVAVVLSLLPTKLSNRVQNQ